MFLSCQWVVSLLFGPLNCVWEERQNNRFSLQLLFDSSLRAANSKGSRRGGVLWNAGCFFCVRLSVYVFTIGMTLNFKIQNRKKKMKAFENKDFVSQMKFETQAVVKGWLYDPTIWLPFLHCAYDIRGIKFLLLSWDKTGLGTTQEDPLPIMPYFEIFVVASKSRRVSQYLDKPIFTFHR